MFKRITFALLMLACNAAGAAVYSCIDRDGAKIIRSTPCEPNEHGEEVKKAKDLPPYSVVHSTGEVTRYTRDAQRTKQRSVAAMQDPQPSEKVDELQNAACEKRRAEIENFKPSNIEGLALQNKFRQLYARDCLGQKPSFESNEKQKRKPDAFFTGKFEITGYGDYHCQYNYAGRYVWKLFRNYCPPNTTGADD